MSRSAGLRRARAPRARRARFAILLAVSAIALAACAHTEFSKARPPIDGRAAARSIELCKTTEAELRARLGEPTRDGVLHGARVVSWITQWDSPPRYLAVMLDERGVVVDLYWDVPTEIPWVPTSQCGAR